MQVFTDINGFRTKRIELPHQARIGLVPTMGALHDGHASLVKRAVSENDFTIVSIFVNPTQFSPTEDLNRYPRSLEADYQLLEKLGVDYVFSPLREEVYPKTAYFHFEINGLADQLCGRSRPGHLNGVVQIVSILFHICQPSHAYFGLKDYQQCLILQHLVRELHFPLQVVPCPIVREIDGLAMSSRNVFLSDEERVQALFLHQSLRAIKKEIDAFTSVSEINDFVLQQLIHFPLVSLDYFEVLNGENLEQVTDLTTTPHLHSFIAAYLGDTRLIDNMRLI